MIVDTSALVAVVRDETGSEPLGEALLTEDGVIPAPVVVEFARVTGMGENRPDPDAEAVLRLCLRSKLRVEDFTGRDAEFASAANPAYGTGNGRGGRLNMLDLMVYGMAKRLERPVLCTGGDFASTDIGIHPASRLG